MLTSLENKVMLSVYNLCNSRSAVLISPLDLIKISNAKGVNLEKLDKILLNLSLDGYFELIYSERHGENIYCITLTEKGKGYARSKKNFRRSVVFRIMLTTALAIFSFLIGIILKRIF